MFECCNNRVRTPLASRRQFLSRLGMGFGALGLAALLREDSLFAADAESSLSPLAAKLPPLPAKAKRVIHIFAQGAPSHVDTWDPKPALVTHDGEPIGGRGVAMGSPFKFQRYGQSGIEVSEVFPKIAEHVDDMVVIRSMFTDVPAHELATVMMNTGSRQLPKPSVGSWALYGLGTENQNMPGYISLHTGGGLPPGGTQNWGSAFLPGIYQGTNINTAAGGVDKMIENISSPYVSTSEQRRQLDLIHQLNELHAQDLQKDAQLEARIEAYEIAFKMQAAASEAFNINGEPQKIKDMYGATPQGRQMLIARRLLESGVRFVQVWAGGWDHHQNIQTRLPASAREIDQPLAALMTDLKQRGLLESTLVIWGGEFGRTPTKDRNGNANPGRDHNAKAFSTWMAGGGVKAGTVYGATDEFGLAAVENPVHVHDLHATILKLLGFDHSSLNFRYNGRDFHLTDVAGSSVTSVNVVNGIIA
jgi:uncharacterized protein DUF1501